MAYRGEHSYYGNNINSLSSYHGALFPVSSTLLLFCCCLAIRISNFIAYFVCWHHHSTLGQKFKTTHLNHKTENRVICRIL